MDEDGGGGVAGDAGQQETSSPQEKLPQSSSMFFDASNVVVAPSSGASSVTSSAVSSPRRRSLDAAVATGDEEGWDEDRPNRRGSMVDLSEEAEEDLANNNDPNNNASNGDDPPMHDANLAVAAAAAAAGGSGANGNDAIFADDSALDLIEVSDFVESALEETRQETLRQELERDVRLILKLMPNRSFDEVHHYLGAHFDKPSRVQIVLNDLLESEETTQAELATGASGSEGNHAAFVRAGSEEIRTPPSSPKQRVREYSPEPTSKNKAGNGLRSKNSKNRPKAAAAAATATSDSVQVGATALVSEMKVPGGDDLPQQPPSEDNDRAFRRKKRPLLDLNLEAHTLDFGDVDDDRSNSKRSRSSLDSDDYDPQEGSSRDHLVVEASVATEVSHKHSKAISSKRDEKPKIELSEDHLHGPFDFKAHRLHQRSQRQLKKNFEKRFDGIRDDLNDVIVERTTSKRDARTSTPPEVVDIDIGSPPVVDLCQSDQTEKNELLANLITMFPDTPEQYLAEQAEELAGKHVATERFITELLARNSQPPDYWQPPNERAGVHPVEAEVDQGEPSAIIPDLIRDAAARQEPESIDLTAPITVRQEPENIDLTEGDLADPRPGPSNSKEEAESEEDVVASKWSTLQILFPQTDPEFLHLKIVEFSGNEEMLNRWIEEGIESKGRDFPTKAQYEKRQQEAEMLDKYSQEVTVKEILDMYSDPETYFGDKTRKVSELYKKHALAQLKKEFRNLSAVAINKAFTNQNGLYYPSFKALQKCNMARRKTKRPDHECSRPQEIDINFLKELQFSRIEGDVKKHKEDIAKLRELKIQEAKKRNELMECVCCYNDECLIEEMLPCKQGHLYCVECVTRASEVAIGEGKTSLLCLGQCDQSFDLSILQKALRANIFSKWLMKIQLNEVREAIPEGLEGCPYCDFVAIMDSMPEENKVLQCQNPDCGKETCRLCKEISHLPLRCDEVEKDSEVRKRTYIENKMSEALIRKCWKCMKPFYKVDGCNKMTCECGAQMCYLCREPVRDYKHFYGQGAQPIDGQTCPLWSDNKRLHESDVARGALEAKTEMDQKIPEVKLRHDPTVGVVLPGDNQQPADFAAIHGPGVEALLGNDPLERARIIQQQQQIEDMIRRQRQGGGGQPGGQPEVQVRQWQDGFMYRMGELLQLREAQRQRHRAIRRRELQALEDFQMYYPRPPNVALPPAPIPAVNPGANALYPGGPPMFGGDQRNVGNDDAQRNIQRHHNPFQGMHVHHHHHPRDPIHFHLAPGPVPPPAHQLNIGGVDRRPAEPPVLPHVRPFALAAPRLLVRAEDHRLLDFNGGRPLAHIPPIHFPVRPLPPAPPLAHHRHHHHQQMEGHPVRQQQQPVLQQHRQLPAAPATTVAPPPPVAPPQGIQGLPPPPVPELDPTEVADILGNRNRNNRRGAGNAPPPPGVYRAPQDDVAGDPWLYNVGNLDEVLDDLHMDL